MLTDPKTLLKLKFQVDERPLMHFFSLRIFISDAKGFRLAEGSYD